MWRVEGGRGKSIPDGGTHVRKREGVLGKQTSWLLTVRAEGGWRGVVGSQLEERGPEHQGVRGWVRLSRRG